MVFSSADALPFLNVGLWAIQAFLAVVFFLGATVRATRYEFARRRMAWVGAVPRPLLLFISAAEILGAAGLVLPGLLGGPVVLTPLAAASLGAVQILALGFHLMRGERRNAVANLALLALAALVIAGRLGAAPAALAAESDASSSRIEDGRIVDWQGGDAVIYPTLGFFGPPQVLAIGAVAPDGSFSVELPAAVPVDMLTQASNQCPTLTSSDPEALTNFTGNYLVFQHGQQVGATHSASSLGFASFSGFADGDTRSGFLYADRPVTLSGYCDRQLTFGSAQIDFLQQFDVEAHAGWNDVVAVLSIPRPGQVVATLRAGSNTDDEQWFLFR